MSDKNTQPNRISSTSESSKPPSSTDDELRIRGELVIGPYTNDGRQIASAWHGNDLTWPDVYVTVPRPEQNQKYQVKLQFVPADMDYPEVEEYGPVNGTSTWLNVSHKNPSIDPEDPEDPEDTTPQDIVCADIRDNNKRLTMIKWRKPCLPTGQEGSFYAAIKIKDTRDGAEEREQRLQPLRVYKIRRCEANEKIPEKLSDDSAPDSHLGWYSKAETVGLTRSERPQEPTKAPVTTAP